MKLLIHKEKREIVDGKEHIVSKYKEYLISDFSRDVNTFYGRISKTDLARSNGSVILSSTGHEFIVFDATFSDVYKRFKKLPQTIPSKDIGLIIVETGLCSDSVVVDGGCGSGVLAAALARVAKRVISYEIRPDHIAVSVENLQKANMKNVELKKKSLYEGIDESDVDVITLDVPEPWKVLPHAVRALRVSGFLVSYSPSVPQVMDFVEEVRKYNSFLILKTVEVLERLWEIEKRKVRPKSISIGHSGFLTFVRKVKD